MAITRREWLAAVATGTALAISGCEIPRPFAASRVPERLEPPDEADAPAIRLLNRTAFGAPADEVAKVERIGREAWVALQLEARQDEPLDLTLRLRRLESLQYEGFNTSDFKEQHLLDELQQAALLRAVHSPNQLRERMVDFWSNHFSIYARKANTRMLKAADDHRVIRRHALGKFPDLLWASAQSPAMLLYLDNQANTKRAPNENYARELLELHALGVDGGYTQQDVMEVARCFTGWTVENRPPLTQLSQHDFDVRKLRARGRFRFDPDQHDDGAKQVLGHTIPAGQGEGDARQVVDILAKHPSCARFIARKLCRAFVGTADAPLVERVADRYTKTDGDIKAMLETLLLSDELLAGPPILKRPFDYVASALRCTYAETDGRAVGDHLRKMGQPLNEWPMPDGYPDGTSEWTGSLLARWNFAAALATDQIRGTKVAFDRLGKSMGGNAEWDRLVCGRSLGLTGDDPTEQVTLALCSPEFQWR